jgi:plastocyanin
MKFLPLIFCFTFLSNITFSQQSHTIVAFDFGFNPDTLYMTAGDTVVLLSQGYHSITEQDSLDWVNNMDTNNGGFWVGVGASIGDDWFVINQPGKYYFNCYPHAAMGMMKGVIYVNAPTGVESYFKSNDFEIINVGNGMIRLKYKKADRIEIYSIAGQLVFSDALQVNGSNAEISLNLTAGTYVATFIKDGKYLATKKVVIE